MKGSGPILIASRNLNDHLFDGGSVAQREILQMRLFRLFWLSFDSEYL